MKSENKLKKGDPCPSCKKGILQVEEFMGDEWLVCKKCGYDNSDPDLEVYGSERSTQREKGKNSPYKAGGPMRTK